MYYLRNFDKQADAVGQKAYLPTIAIVGGVNKVGYFDGDASKDSVFSEDGDFINVGEKETRVVCAYNVTQTTGETQLLYSGLTLSEIASMEIDGVNATVSTGYTFTTTGEHTVKYTFKDNTTIGYYAFMNCFGLTSIVIPDSVTSIGNYAFSKCSSLTSVVIPDSVTNIGEEAFNRCTSLTSVVIPDSVTNIGESAFSYCPALTSITVDTGNTTYDSRDNCNATIETSTNTLIFGCQSTIIPDSVTTIGDCAFYQCFSLTSITIPNSVTSISHDAFRICFGLTSIVIPDSVTTISYNAFAQCSGLTSVTIGSGVTSIGSQAFYNCTGLTTIKYTGTVSQWKKVTRDSYWHSYVPSDTKVTCTDGTCGLDDK
jgi:hypothetical protein